MAAQTITLPSLKRGTFALESAHCEGSGHFRDSNLSNLVIFALAQV